MRGYIRPTKRRPRDVQLAAIASLRPDEVYEDDGRNGQDIDAVIASLRYRGDVVAVPTLRVISSYPPRLRKVIDRVHKIGAVIIDGDGRKSSRASDVVAMIAEAAKKEGHPSDVARRAGMRGAARAKYSRTRVRKALPLWRRTDVTNAEFERKTGIPYQTMRRRIIAYELGDPSRGPAGRKPQRT